MSLQVTGKHIGVGDSFKAYAAEKLEAAVGKYIGEYLTAHVRVEKERGRFITKCSVRLRTGLVLEATGDGPDAYASADATFEHLEKRLRRYKRRLKSRHHGADGAHRGVPETQINDYVVELSDRPGRTDGRGGGEDHPVIVAETERTLRQLAVSEAVMQLDLTDDAFLVFRNASSGAINVVYRRGDGNIGWIDPESSRPGAAFSEPERSEAARTGAASPGSAKPRGGKSSIEPSGRRQSAARSARSSSTTSS